MATAERCTLTYGVKGLFWAFTSLHTEPADLTDVYPEIIPWCGGASSYYLDLRTTLMNRLAAAVSPPKAENGSLRDYDY